MTCTQVRSVRECSRKSVDYRSQTEEQRKQSKVLGFHCNFGPFWSFFVLFSPVSDRHPLSSTCHPASSLSGSFVSTMFTSRVFTNENFLPNPSFPSLRRWPDNLHPQYTRNTKNLTIAIQTLALWKSISSNTELAAVIKKFSNYALLVTAGTNGDPYFLHNLTYDPIDQTFTGFPWYKLSFRPNQVSHS